MAQSIVEVSTGYAVLDSLGLEVFRAPTHEEASRWRRKASRQDRMCGRKIRYTEHDARRVVSKNIKNQGRSRRRVGPTRFYACPYCEYHHLTSKPAVNSQSK